MSSTTLDIAQVRSAFLALKNSDYIYADNAGGSQCLTNVVEKLSDYLLRTNVQLGADYSVSTQSTDRVQQGREAAKELFNAASKEEVSFGYSSSLLAENLSRAIENDVLDGEEIIVTGEHEANAGPWKKLATRRNLTIKLWHATQIADFPNNPYAVALQVEELLPLITSKTRLIAFPGCSNILGSIVPVKAVTAAARAKAKELGARKLEISVDTVAYAPHRRVDVQDWDIDYCILSMYKLYGPHIAALYTRKASLESSISPLTHHFLPFDSTSLKLQPGGPGYELAYSVTAIPEYLRSLTPSGTLSDAFKAIAEHEQTLIRPLLAYLKSQEARGVHIVGNEITSLSRVPTISFVVQGDKPISSQDVVKVFDSKGNIGIRYGHFYAYTLVEHLHPKLDLADSVVRISLVHYNTVEEVQTIINILKEILEA